ncbi:3-deoxy-7-phosphoheptulonate synthase [Carnimonas nigrificans]|uniref:3-deoxy-7-phosphoheptulonate synthase n=1 Tax=Carnimonas nigrificans TaxID=64323 RepID=UPI0004B00E34|nr:3-deoxy-7-phosphoheptulonate synthase [Carnimonas nigrificans]
MTTDTTEAVTSQPVLNGQLPSIACLRDQFPLTPELTRRIAQQREQVRNIINGQDSRMLVVVGPCSLHDRRSALEYAERLASLSRQVDDQLLLVMRAYIEKPRTTVGWKGLLYDPFLDGSDDMASGLEMSRALMIELLERGVPLANELLNPMVAGYFSDLLAWGAIGARTTESQVHRELVSGLPFPTGFKNGTDGSFGAACDAIGASARAHHYFGLSETGMPSMVATLGNPDTHMVLRGGRNGPNHDEQSIALARTALEQAGYCPSIMVDCSHGNSLKDPTRQPLVFEDVVRQRLNGERSLHSVMIESHLEEGKQPISNAMRYGVSVTDGCLGWENTATLLRQAADRLRAQ